MPVGSLARSIVARRPPVLDGPPSRALLSRAAYYEDVKEANVLLRPHPPFRAKPSRRPSKPKRLGTDVQKEKPAIAVKARRHPVKVARLTTAPTLKVLSLEEAHA